MDAGKIGLLRRECSRGNDRACEVIERLCQEGYEPACRHVPETY